MWPVYRPREICFRLCHNASRIHLWRNRVLLLGDKQNSDSATDSKYYLGMWHSTVRLCDWMNPIMPMRFGHWDYTQTDPQVLHVEAHRATAVATPVRYPFPRLPPRVRQEIWTKASTVNPYSTYWNSEAIETISNDFEIASLAVVWEFVWIQRNCSVGNKGTRKV